MRQLGQRIRLIHELRELRSTEEIANDRAERFWIDKLLRRHSINVDVKQRHALFDEPLGARETDAALIRQQFANRAHTAATEMVDIVERALAPPQVDQVLDRADEIFVR